MANNLTAEKALIFRITHINNVPWILRHGLHCKNSGVQDPNFVRIGNLELIQRRTARNVPVAPGGSLSDYIPFYFTPFSMMMYNIKTGYGGIRQFPNTEIVIMASSLRGLEDRGVATVFSDRHAYLQTAQFFTSLDDLDKVHPDRLLFPDYHQQLADAMRRETELFFNGLVRDDRGVLELYNADYTYLNERLAKHYGIEGVVGERFRRVRYPDETRRGLLGHGSILTLTSHAGRTSPVLRGKWVMEVLLGTPPPPPPPGIPDLDETEGSEDGRLLTTRERMALHRSSPSCSSCHRFMDPIGLALDNFDVTGRWRIRENGMPLDTQGELYDGTPVSSPMELQEALVKRPIPLIRTFTENLMTYALGRRVEYFDQPTIRAITQKAASDGYKMSTFILGVATSQAFQMQQATDVVEQPSGSDG